MSRPRKLGNKGLPANLYRKLDKRTGKAYYTYRNPQTGSDHGMGIDHDAAVNDAHALNSTIYQSMKAAAIVAKNAETTELYRDVRGAEWIQVKVG